MKLLYLKTKSITTAVIIAMMLTSLNMIHAAQTAAHTSSYTGSIESIYHYFDDNIVKKFQKMFKTSFSLESDEKLDETAQKLKTGEQDIQNYVQQLNQKAYELEQNHQTDTDLYRFIQILLQLAYQEIGVHFTAVYNTLTSGLQQKLTAARFAQELVKVAETIVTDKNFKRIDASLAELQDIAPRDIADKILVIRTDLRAMLDEYKKNKAKQSSAIRLFRKRLPYKVLN